MTSDFNIDVLSITETWLTSDCSSSFVDIPGYEFYRGDTDSDVRKHGTGLYVNRSLAALPVQVQIPNVAAVFLPGLCLYIVSVYRPPSYSREANEDLARFLIEFSLGKELVVMGDFNLPTLRWNEEEFGGAEYITPTDRFFRERLAECGLTQLVLDSTFYPSGNILDLILCSDADRFFDVECVSPLPNCHHCPVVGKMIYQVDEIDRTGAVERYSWSKGDYNALINELFDVQWELLFEGLYAEECYQEFLERVWELIPQYVPKQEHRNKSRWMTRPPQSLKNQRKRQWSRFKQLRRELGRRNAVVQQAWNDYIAINRQIRAYAINHQSAYEERLADLLKTAPKAFHSYLRARKTGCPSVGPLRVEDGELIAEQSRMGEVFAEAFASVYVGEPPENPSEFPSTNGQMVEFTVNYDRMLEKLNELKVSSSPGPDGIHPMFLHMCAQALIRPLIIVFRKSLEEHKLPSQWKVSRVVPIFKGGSKAVALNYRPVSLTSTPCKVMERLLVDHIVQYLEDSELLANGQFGFRQGRGVEDQLLLMYGEIVEIVDSGGMVDVVYLDLSKAFDVVNHQVLLAMLRELGFSRLVMGWIEDFLIGRSMFVSVGPEDSEDRDVLSGVPQGSVLGPLLFLIYVNGLTAGMTCKWYAFADDYKIYSRGAPGGGADRLLQLDLNLFSERASSWNLKINPAKSVVMRFGSGTQPAGANYLLAERPLQFVSNHRDLGVMVDYRLRFHDHVAGVVRKSRGLVNQLLRGTICRKPKFMITLFISHIRPLMDFSARVWNVGYLGDLKSLERVQKGWVRQTEGMQEQQYENCLKQLGVYSVYGRLLRGDLIKIWQAFHTQADVGLMGLLDTQTHAATRGNGLKLAIPRCQTELKRRFWNVRCVQRWNSLPADVVQARTLECFKGRLDRHVGDLFFSTLGD